jgi:hypothetical protein
MNKRSSNWPEPSHGPSRDPPRSELVIGKVLLPGSSLFAYSAFRTFANAPAANEHLGLTGMLLYSESDSSFFQVLEGESATIDALYRKLLLDKRHAQVLLFKKNM